MKTLGHALQQAWLQRGLAARLLWPLSWLMLGLVRLRRVLYRLGVFRAQRAGVPVIVVGNVVAGGAGKTPTVLAVADHLRSRGWRPGIISRGHGRRGGSCREVQPDSAADELGDEPVLMRQRSGVPVFVAARRVEAARALLAAHPDVNILIADDGLQHLALHRDVEILVFDERGIGNGWLLPAGPLREPWPRAADLVLNTGQVPVMAGLQAQRSLADEALRADGTRVALQALQGRPLLALAGIARPEQFFAMLRARGLTLARTLPLADHQDFRRLQLPLPADAILLCTEKDAVKLWRTHREALAVPLLLTPEPAFFAGLDQLLSKHGHQTP